MNRGQSRRAATVRPDDGRHIEADDLAVVEIKRPPTSSIKPSRAKSPAFVRSRRRPSIVTSTLAFLASSVPICPPEVAGTAATIPS